MSISYDPEIINAAALALYEEARTIVRSMMIKYGFIFFFVGSLTAVYINSKTQVGGTGSFVVVLFFTVIGAYGGRKAAATKVLGLKLQAQTALCQVEIEKNSRP